MEVPQVLTHFSARVKDRFPNATFRFDPSGKAYFFDIYLPVSRTRALLKDVRTILSALLHARAGKKFPPFKPSPRKRHVVVVEYRPDEGFGVSDVTKATGLDGLFEGHDQVYPSVEAAFIAVVQLIERE